MRIGTQFLLTMLLFGVILASMSASAIITSGHAEETSRQENMAAGIARGASELGYLANDYVIFREEQQLSRWQARFASFSADVAGLAVDRPEQQALVRNITANQLRMKQVFDSIAAGVASDPQAPIDPAAIQVSWSRMAVQSQGLSSDATRLAQLLRDEVEQLQRTNLIVIFAMVVVLGAFLTVIYLTVQRRVLKSIGALQAGIATIGSGDLDYRIEEKANDEVGDLSRAFNRMTSDLKTVTASKKDLQQEISERKKAEEQANRQKTVQEAINRILDAYLKCDTEEKLALHCLNIAEEVTQSRIGFIGEVGADGLLHDKAMSNPSYEACAMQDKSGHRRPPGDFKLHGLYGRVIQDGRSLLTNDTPSHPDSIGAPAGHPRMQSFLGAPLVHGGRTIGMLALANREGGYRPEDLETVEALAPAIVETTMRKRAEQALAESEDKYRSLFSTMSEGFGLQEVILDAEGKPCDYRFLELNDAFEKLTGLSREKALGSTVREVLPDIDPHWIETYGRVALTGEPVHFENYSSPLGRWYDTYAYSPGKGRFAVVFVDVTERRQAEEALRESEERLARAQEIAHLGSWELDVANGKLTWSDETYRIFGLEPREFGAIYEAFLKAVHPEDRAAVDAAYSDSIRERRDSYEIEHRILRKPTGDVRYVHEKAQHVRDETGKIVRSVGMVLDITERKRAQERLAYLATYPEMNPLLVTEVDSAGNVTYANPSARMHFPGVESAGDKHPYHAGLTEAMQATRASFTRELKIGDRYYDQTVTAVPNSRNLRTYGRDITERREAELELRQRTAELEASNRELEAFSYSVSHDLRAPLRSIEGFSGALLEDYVDKLDDLGKQYLRTIQESSDLMGRLIDDMLRLSRVTRAEMDFQDLDLGQMAHDVVAGLRSAEPGRKAEVTIEGGMVARGDRELLRMVLQNLLGNAWKFTGKVESPRIEMGVTSLDGQGAYYVRDNGAGFDMAYGDKLFKPFQRLHGASEFGGTGIGLATVQRIIARHGGRVWAEGKVGEGATFYFTLG